MKCLSLPLISNGSYLLDGVLIICTINVSINSHTANVDVFVIRRKMSECPHTVLGAGISLYENVIENPQDVIDVALASDKWKSSAFMLGGNKTKIDKDIRDAKVLDLAYNLEGDIFSFSLSKILYDAAKDYCERWSTGFEKMEHPQILHYTKGEGHYGKHSDSSPENKRIFSSVLYLNDVEEGGETHFVHFGIDVSPKAGSLLMFPAEYSYMHVAKPPVSNDKFVVVTWFNPWEKN